MNYEKAIEAVKQGHKVTREAWLEPDGGTMGGKTQALMLVEGAEAPYLGIGRITIEPFVAQYVVGGAICAYQPAHEDKVAKDWKIFS
jgi:hypothetical protein